MESGKWHCFFLEGNRLKPKDWTNQRIALLFPFLQSQQEPISHRVSTRLNSDRMLHIKILGIECSRHKALKANLEEALRTYPVSYELEEVHDVNAFMRFSIGSVPALVINDQVIAEGKSFSPDELVEFLKMYQPVLEKNASVKSIIVPTDFSDTASNAFVHAQHLAALYDSPITVLHVYHPEVDPTNPYLAEPVTDLRELKEELLEKFIDQHRADTSASSDVPVSVSSEMVIGFAGEEIIRLANERHAAMIVMGMTGESGIFGKLFGSVSSHVSQKADTPVLLIPQDARFSEYRKIVYASNYLRGDEVVLSRILSFGASFDAQFHIVHVQMDPEQKVDPAAREAFRNFFARHGSGQKMVFRELQGEEVPFELNRYIEENDIDLTVMLTRHRSFWQNLLHKSVVRHMATITSKPMLVIHFDL